MKLAIGLPVTSSIDDDLSLLRGTLDDVHWVPRRQGLLMLRSIGHIDRYHLIDDISLSLSHLTWAPFTIKLQQVLHHPGSQEDRLAAPVIANTALTHLQKRIETRVRNAGCSPLRQRFSPEITLGYMQPGREHDIIPWIQRHNLFSSCPMNVDHICLIEQFSHHDALSFQVLETYNCYGQLMDPSLLSDDF